MFFLPVKSYIVFQMVIGLCLRDDFNIHYFTNTNRMSANRIGIRVRNLNIIIRRNNGTRKHALHRQFENSFDNGTSQSFFYYACICHIDGSWFVCVHILASLFL